MILSWCLAMKKYSHLIWVSPNWYALNPSKIYEGLLLNYIHHYLSIVAYYKMSGWGFQDNPRVKEWHASVNRPPSFSTSYPWAALSSTSASQLQMTRPFQAFALSQISGVHFRFTLGEGLAAWGSAFNHLLNLVFVFNYCIYSIY